MSMAERRAAARQQKNERTVRAQAEKTVDLSIDGRVKVALASQALPAGWLHLLSDRQKQRLAATVDETGTATAATATVARAVRAEVYDARKATVDDDVEVDLE